jgi:hypothetical protein
MHKEGRSSALNRLDRLATNLPIWILAMWVTAGFVWFVILLLQHIISSKSFKDAWTFAICTLFMLYAAVYALLFAIFSIVNLFVDLESKEEVFSTPTEQSQSESGREFEFDPGDAGDCDRGDYVDGGDCEDGGD